MADLQELFSRLKSPAAPASDKNTASVQNQGPSIWAQPSMGAGGGYQQPSVSSPLFSPPMHTPNPQHQSAIMSPNFGTPHGHSPMPDAKANNLLNLLKFSNSHLQTSAQQQQQQQQQSPLASMQNIGGPGRSPSMGNPQTAQPPQHSRTVSASDLVASFQPKQPASTLRNFIVSPQPEAPAGPPEAFSAPREETQNFLLSLLHRPKQVAAEPAPVQAPIPQQVSSDAVDNLVRGLREAALEASGGNTTDTSQGARETTPARLFGSDSREATPFDVPQVQVKKGPVFTYVNPFEQLSASSPKPTGKPEGRVAPPKVEILKHGRDASGSADGESSAPLPKTRKLTTIVPSPAPSPFPPRPASQQVPADVNHQSVSATLNNVGEQVDKQVEKALAAAAAAGHASNATNDKSKPAEDVADSWESADADETPAAAAAATAKDHTGRVVPVYNFPMKPFVSIEIRKADDVTPVRPDSLMDVARLKKDFEQIDRTLVTASTNHIVYSMSKDGGFRIIRQDSGKDKKVFRNGERIFSLQISSASAAHKDTEAILGTGVDGSVFWTNIVKVEGDVWDEYNLESQGFILPPVPVQDDNTSGSPVKTRAKMSSRHADFFAISRGKSIYIISPYVARHPTYADKKTHVVNNERYLQERCLKIHTGKAGKDFAFSEDDSLLVSLDKSGRIKFWDIREMAESAQDTNLGIRKPIELKNPLMTLTATLPLEKATPSSIMFVDKERPCVKGVALRYLIVGMKQNHILQLWDLGLNKPVQEIHFPHDKDSDAICSIAYHPKTGIIALGHPTRNSIYFIHLSAPRYNIQSMDQARYITMLASEDPNLARPESTAIMSGIRELSFASKGELRSVDMLKSPVPSGSSDNALFELYAMHSKGVTTITVKHEDLGWAPDNKVLKPIDGEDAGYIAVTDLRATLAVPAASTPSETTSEVPAKTIAKNVAPSRVEPTKPANATRVPSKQDSAGKEPAPVNGTAKIEKAKKGVPEAAKSAEQATNPAILTPASYALAAQKNQTPAAVAVDATPSTAKAAATADKQSLPTNGTSASLDIESVNKTLNDSFSRGLDGLYHKLDDDRRVQDAAAAAKQDAILRLVSSTLTENVERSLSSIVTSGITNNVLPAINTLIASALDSKLESALSASLSASVSKEVKAAMPAAISLALQDKALQRTISEQASSKVAAQAEQAFAAILRNTVVPNFTKLAISATEKAIADSERRFAEQNRQVQIQRQADNTKIEQLTNLVVSLSNTIDGMAASQTAFQEQILRLQRQADGPARGGSGSAASTAPTTEPQGVRQSVEDQELQVIEDLMHAGNYEEATIQVS